MLRNLFGLVLLLSVLWFSLTVPLGNKTLVQHVRAIGSTPEAHDLYDGAKSTLEPAVTEAKDRLVGEVLESSSAIKERAEDGVDEIDDELSRRTRKGRRQAERQLDEARERALEALPSVDEG